MNLDDLKNFKFDLETIKNISPEDVRNFISDRQALVLSVALALITGLVITVILNGRFKEYAQLNSQLEILSAKEQPIKDYDKVIKEAQQFLTTIPPAISESNIISFITDLANRRQIQVDSFDPVQVKTRSFFRETKLSFKFEAISFQKALLFIHDLESSKFLIKIDDINMQKTATTPSEDKKKDVFVSLNLSITSIELINNDKKKNKKK
jgi:hypothetical protein